MRSLTHLHGSSMSFFFSLCFLFFSGTISSQAIIKGKITGRDGIGLSGATIRVKATDIFSLADSIGHFAIKANPGNVIEFSFVGYHTRQIALRNETYLDVALIETAVNLNEVVVIGYGTTKKKDLTGAIGSISEKDFNKGIFTSPDQLIQGKISGVQLTYNNGQPGGTAMIKIRGNSALTGTGQPLFVIDGVPLDGRSLQAGNNPLNFINPNDIASIDVLKDASATAIYGSRAAYGVIILNTKKGKAGQPSINVEIFAGVSSILKKIEVLNASEYREAIKYYNVSNLNDKGGNVDALDAILQNGFQQSYNMAISGGNENGKYRISANLLDQEGIIRNTGLKKYAIDLSTNFKFLESKKLGLDLNVTSSQYLQNVPSPAAGSSGVIQAALQWNPTDSLRKADGSLNIF
ncbi:MAG TPA: TonB-dependent receptor plug domain-containing protein, partial [Chitinophagaceae bacterium]|nr:TonB-dependent receptor plug domain-containing protein [Chitinophagaceae bacterium]